MKLFKNIKMSKGASLVEMIVYIAVLAFVSVFVVSALVIMAQAFIDFRVSRNIVDTATISLERIVREARFANDINAAGSVLGTSPGTLLLDTTDPDTGLDTTVEFSVSSGQLMITEGISAPGQLSSDKVTITNLVFREIATSTTKAVKIEMELSSGVGDTERSEKFYDTAILRNHY